MDLSRRRFLRGSTDPTPRVPARPPWALVEADFVDRCTRCGGCVRACPHRLIHDGDGGFPEIAFDRDGCSFCRACLDSCKPHALNATRPAFTARVAVAAHCLNRHRVECRTCGEACDERALRFVPAVGGVSRLSVDRDRCTGCGACVAPCPVGAITIEPLIESVAAGVAH